MEGGRAARGERAADAAMPMAIAKPVTAAAVRNAAVEAAVTEAADAAQAPVAAVAAEAAAAAIASQAVIRWSARSRGRRRLCCKAGSGCLRSGRAIRPARPRRRIHWQGVRTEFQKV